MAVPLLEDPDDDAAEVDSFEPLEVVAAPDVAPPDAPDVVVPPVEVAADAEDVEVRILVAADGLTVMKWDSFDATQAVVPSAPHQNDCGPSDEPVFAKGQGKRFAHLSAMSSQYVGQSPPQVFRHAPRYINPIFP